MFSFFATILGLKWISDHGTEILIGVCVIVMLIIISSVNKRRRIRANIEAEANRIAEQDRLRQAQEEKKQQQRIAAEEKRRAEGFFDTPFVMPDINGLPLAYSYPDVELIPEPNAFSYVNPTESLSFICTDETVNVYQSGNKIAVMKPNRLAEMVREWQKDDRPVVGQLVRFSPDSSIAIMSLSFYDDILARFKIRNPECKILKLTGKPEEMIFEPTPGARLTLEYDYEKDKFSVQFDNCHLGYLPASAATYAEKQELNVEDLEVILDHIDDNDYEHTYYYVAIA